MYKLLLLPLLLFAGLSFGQTVEPWLPPVINSNGDTLQYGALGGLNTPQYSELDLNNDGKMDLLVYDRSGQIALTFLNEGGPNEINYKYAPKYQKNFPQGTRNFMLARDFNCDGIADLFFFNQPPFTSGGIGVYKGRYNADNELEFDLYNPLLEYTHPQFGVSDIFIFNPDVPAIEDIDFDGDLDIAAFTLDFTFQRNVYYYRNTSMDDGHGCDSLNFILEHECHGMFSESGFDNVAILSNDVDSCAGNPYWGRMANPRHIGSTVTLVDWNADRKMDLLMGDVSVNTLNMLTAEIVNDTFLFVSQDITYPSYDVPVNIFSYPAGYFVDVDNDGDKDMIASPTELATGEAVTDSVSWLYLNNSPDSTMQLEFQQKDFMVGQMIDLGMGSFPTIVDVNADGLLDLVVGHFAYTDTFNVFSTSLHYYENVGTATAPIFQLMDEDFAGLASLGQQSFVPTFGDIDGDGDQDLLVGLVDGTLDLIENTAGANQAMIWGNRTDSFAGIDAGSVAYPQLMDLDRDGDLDLVVGNDIGRMYYYENDGDANTPDFPSSPSSNAFGFDLTAYGGSLAAPHFVDLGTDFELFLGYDDGKILQFNNIDGNVTGLYDTLSLDFMGFWQGRNSSIAVADLDGDGERDFVLGNIRGGISFYRPSYVDTTTSHNVLAQSSSFSLFPNPNQGEFVVKWEAPLEAGGQLFLFDLMGRLIEQQQLVQGQQYSSFQLTDLPAGQYLLQYRSKTGQQEVQKVIIR